MRTKAEVISKLVDPGIIAVVRAQRFEQVLPLSEALLEGGVIAIGSGGSYAKAAATALMENTDIGAREIVEKGLNIAADICIYTNQNLTIEELE